MTPRIACGDRAAFLSLLRGAAKWLEDSGRGMWPPEEIAPEAFAHLPDEAFVVAYDADRPVGAMTLTFADPLFWPDVPAGRSGYIHKLCIDRAYAGQALPEALLAFAEALCRQRGIPALRLDTGADREKLRALYARLGFAEVGILSVCPEWTAVLLCKPLLPAL